MVLRLKRLCINATARVLMRCNRRIEVPDYNPIRPFPSDVVEGLMKTICRFSTELVFSHVFLLLTSDRMTRFDLSDVEIRPQVADDIFRALQPWGDRLKSIMIDVSSWQYGPCQALGDLLLATKGELIILVSNIPFRLSALSQLPCLKKLVINFEITDRFSKYLLDPIYRCGQIMEGNEQLRILRIANYRHAQTLLEDLTQIITKFWEVVEIDYDVLPNLKLIPTSNHGIKQYKLLKTRLGETWPDRACKDDMHAVSLQCPDLFWLDFYPNDHDAITALSKFPKLSFLTLTAKSSEDPDDSSDNFHFGLRPLLEDGGFGSRLTNLILHDVVDVDLSIIAACCPNLEELGAFGITEYASNAEFPPNSFSKVTSLCLENAEPVPTEEVSVVGILSNAPLLELLTIERANNLNDEILDVILQSNPTAFSKIILMNMYETWLTEEGLHKIMRAIVSSDYDRQRRVQIHTHCLNPAYSKEIINSYIRNRITRQHQ